MSVDKNERQRGSDPEDSPVLQDGDGGCGEADVVIGAEQGDQTDQQAADGLNQACTIEPGVALLVL
ncbi:MAG: hypothetical protein KXJ50_08170 [Vulcanococcus sp.]|uniref:hypothetical protein n=1 Tax=Vulcanococcus sp. TaxID=2856995 RepID=UPI002601165B|nr:hypothetical protein [Vulcanococcus sp.]MBW0174375.1 hypothetical protein [Vulcanococcus sp.]MBW0181025.1 hypothetical protein [Vulcanococcus sp.]